MCQNKCIYLERAVGYFQEKCFLFFILLLVSPNADAKNCNTELFCPDNKLLEVLIVEKHPVYSKGRKIQCGFNYKAITKNNDGSASNDIIFSSVADMNIGSEYILAFQPNLQGEYIRLQKLFFEPITRQRKIIDMCMDGLQGYFMPWSSVFEILGDDKKSIKYYIDQERLDKLDLKLPHTEVRDDPELSLPYILIDYETFKSKWK